MERQGLPLTDRFQQAGDDRLRQPLIKQAVVPVMDDDTAHTLAARILKEEHRIYSEAIALVLAGRYRIEGRRVIELP